MKNRKELINYVDRLNRIFSNIVSRCCCADGMVSHWYRGTTVFPKWRRNPASFVLWCLKNGWEPHLDVSRINPRGNYTPYNVRFTTTSETLSNRKGSQYGNKKTPLNIHKSRKRYLVVLDRAGKRYRSRLCRTVGEAVQVRDWMLEKIDKKGH